MPDMRQEKGFFSFSGIVGHGQARGRQLGFPTANLEVDRAFANPLNHGVYAGFTRWEDEPARGAVVNIGVRPTFTENSLSVEVHVLDFEGDLYGKRVAVTLMKKLRDERPFPSAESLVEQIVADVEQARRIWRERMANNIHMEV